MQKDMHYFGTYCLARAAGIKRASAKIVASAAEYVDDATLDESIHLEDGRSLLTEVTAHKMIDYKNADADDQRNVWLPFHFLPGGVGVSLAERLVCTKDSPLAQEMVKRNLQTTVAAPDYALHLLGITAHVYADTFAHYGFIGANHPLNGIKKDTIKTETDPASDIHAYIWGKAEKMWNNIISSALSDAFPLGHGAAVTFPDRPYLKWSYKRKHDGREINRDNHKDFLEGAKALHAMFKQFLVMSPAHIDPAGSKSWAVIRPQVSQIFALEGSSEERSKAWKRALKGGVIAAEAENLPKYLGEKWSETIEEIAFRPGAAPETGKLVKKDVHKFYRAARAHRNLVLTDLLPSRGILAA